MSGEVSRPPLRVAIVVATLAAFAIDMLIPLGVAAGIIYVLVVVMAAWEPKPGASLWVAAVSTALVLLGWALSEPLGIAWMVALNRLLAVLAIWATAIAVWRRKEGEAELARSRQIVQTLLSNLPGMAYRRDPDEGTLSFTSEERRSLTGLSRPELAGRRWLELVHPDDRDRVVRATREAMESGRPYQVRYRILDSRGRERWVEDRGRGVTGDGAGPAHLEGLVCDITDQRGFEQELSRAERMAAIGVLAAGFAHEIGNPLAAISAIAEIEASKATADTTRTRLEQIGSHVERVSRIMRQMMDIAHPQAWISGPVAINDLVREAVSLVAYDKRAKDVSITVDLHEDLPVIDGVSDQLMQVFTNLGLNSLAALDACAERSGTIVVRTAPANGRDGGVRISWEDNGPGFDEAVADKLFQPFFTTREEGQGTGLGLATSWRIVRDHGGRITATSRPGAGARFDVILPASARTGAAGENRPGPE